MLRFTLSILLLALLPTTDFFAQSEVKAILQSLEKKHDAVITINKTTDKVRFLRFPAEKSPVLVGNNLKAKAENFWKDYGAAFGVENRQELHFTENRSDRYGKKQLRFQQKIAGVPVFASDMRLHFDENDRLTAAHGVYIPNIGAAQTPVISAELAAEKALQFVENHTRDYATSAPLYVHTNELTYYQKGLIFGQTGAVKLTYHLEIRNDENVREYVFIDAATGKVFEQYTGMPHILHRRVYENNTSNQVWNEGDAFPGSLSIWEQNEVETAGHTYYFFENAFGYTSYDNADAEMRTVHTPNGISNCGNASWNGSTSNFCDGSASDDVVGHEWGHAYTEYTNGLIYAWQSGALNESYSDIWGETIDLLNNYEDADEDLSLRNACASSDRWRLGEDALAFGNPIRDMYDPTCNGDPGKVSDAEYHCTTGDNGGVHVNSGVNNHLYVLLVDGGVYNGQTISPLGFTKAAHIFWRAQSVYLTQSSDFNDQADALEAACADLVGINLEGLTTGAAPAGLSGEIITVADCQEVTEAILAVEMRDAPACNFQPILNQNEPNLCTGTDTESNIFFADFESGMQGFTTIDIPTNPGTWESRVWELDNTLPRNRPGTAMFGTDPINGNCSSDLENGIIRLLSPTITVPADRTSTIYLTFDHYVATELRWDGGNMKYSINGGTPTILPASAFIFNGYNSTMHPASSGNDNPLAGEPAFTGTDGGSVRGSWGKSQVDLSSLGLTETDDIQLIWEVGTDGCNGNDGWYIDNVQVCTCEALVLPVELTNFTAKPTKRSIDLTWQTATEFNNAGFSLERSLSPDRDFSETVWLTGRGNSEQTSDYDYSDKNVTAGLTYYYRLRQIDFDGKETLSEVVSARIEATTEYGAVFFPNPAKNQVTLQVFGYERADFDLTIYDAAGKVTARFSDVQDSFDISALPPGLYWVEITHEQGNVVEKLVVE